MTQAEKQHMMLHAPLGRLIVRMAIPTILTMLITTFYNMADTFFVGMLGSDSATGAVGVAAPAMNIIQAVAFFFGQGSGNAVSRKLGKQETADAERLVACGFFGALTAGVCFGGIGLCALTPFCRLLGATETILPYAKLYLVPILAVAPLMMGSLVLNNQLRFQGCAAYGMVGMMTGSILNTILDPLFMFVLDMGIFGAALATAVSQCVGFTILLVCRYRAHCVPIRISALRGIPQLLSEITHGGLPSLCRQGLSGISTACLNIAAKPFGDAAIAAMSVVGRIMWFASATTMGFGQGFQPVCGYNYGAGKTERVKSAFWFSVRTTTVMLLILSAVCASFADSFVALFRDSESVISIGSYALRLHCTTLPLFGFISLSNMLFQTCRKTAAASILAAARQGLFFFPTVLLLSNVWGLFGIQITQVFSDTASFLLALGLNLYILKRL